MPLRTFAQFENESYNRTPCSLFVKIEPIQLMTLLSILYHLNLFIKFLFGTLSNALSMSVYIASI